jgi:uncharacterized protein
MRLAPTTTVMPRLDRGIQYAAASPHSASSLEYWIARSGRAMTARLWLLLALFLSIATAATADVAVPQLTGRVVDQTGTLSSGDIASLNRKLGDFEAKKGSQVAVLIVPTTQPETIEQYSIRVADAWKIGRKKVDDGAILLVAKNDHHLRIEVGYGLEGALTDVTSRRIIDEVITPKFRTGDFAGGVSDGVDRIIGVIDGEPLPAPARSTSYSNSDISDLGPLVPFGLFAALFVGGILRTMLGRLLGSVATGGVLALLAWFMAGSAVLALAVGAIAFFLAFIADLFPMASGPGTGYSRGGSWSSGSSGGGWSSGSSSDSGSFSGGGGSFGGGGASGSW